MNLNNFSVLELIKAVVVLVWIIAGFILFYEDLTLIDEEVETVTPQEKETVKVIEKTIIKETVVVQSVPAPTLKAAPLPPVSEGDDTGSEEDNALANVIFFKKPIQSKKDFYERLPDAEKKEFKSLFIDEGPKHLVPSLQYTIGQNNDPFFTRAFNDIYAYRKVISPALLKRLTDEMVSLAGTDVEAQSLLLEAATRTAYAARTHRDHLALAQTLSAQDIELQKQHLKPKGKYVYSYVRQAIILEKQGKNEEALAVVEDALTRQLDDRTKGNFKARKERLLGLVKPKVVVLDLPKPTAKKPVLPPVAATDAEDDGEPNVMENVEFFKNPIVDRPEFYDQLTDAEKKEFRSYFVDLKEAHLVQGLVYTIQGDNKDYFKRVFNYVYLFRKTISLSLLVKLTHELLHLAGSDEETKTLIYETASRTAYYRRKDTKFLEQVEAWCLSDIDLHRSSFNSKNQYVYSFVRYAIVLEKQDRIPEALDLVKDALTRKLDDRTQGNYPERQIRLLGKMPKAPEPVKEEEPEEEVQDEAELENIQIFKTEIKAREGFYESLTADEQQEFDRYFVHEGSEHLAKELQYVKGGNNNQFFTKVFNFIYRYRKLISLGLLVKLSDELQSFTSGDPTVQTILYELAIRVAYFRRKVPAYLETAERWSRTDVQLHRTTLNSLNQYVYSFTRLAIILEKKKVFKEALELVEDALKRELNDKTRTGYEGRKVRILKKMAAIKS
jgi:hypothetical protein